jgi:hypothetical protein
MASDGREALAKFGNTSALARESSAFKRRRRGDSPMSNPAHFKYSPQAHAAFRSHFRRYAPEAGRHSIIASAETETNPHELLRFAEARFHSLIRDFEASFFDSWTAIGSPFQQAAKDSVRGPRA